MSTTSSMPLNLSRSPSPSLESFNGASDVESEPSSAIMVPSGDHQLGSSVAGKGILPRHSDSDGAILTQQESESDVGSVARLAREGNQRREGFFDVATFVVFVVQGFIYRIYSGFLTARSTYWEERLAAPDYVDAPIVMDDVSPQEMDAFMIMVRFPRKASLDSKTQDQWAVVLRLATEWQFDDIRAAAIEGLGPLASPCEKLVLGRLHHVDNWLHPAFVELCLRPEPLNLAEVKILSHEDIVLIMTAREAVRCGRLNPPTKNEVSAYVMKHILKQPDDTASRSKPEHDSRERCPCRLMTPQPLQGLSVPTTDEELYRLVDWLSYCELVSREYSKVIAVLEEHNVNTFCDIMFNFSTILKDEHGHHAQWFTVGVFHHSAVEPEFIPVGVKLFSTISNILRDDTSSEKRIHMKEGVFRSQLAEHVTVLKMFWDAINPETSAYDNFKLRLRHSMAINPSTRIYFESMVGDCDYLSHHQDIYELRCNNLRTFIAALAEAGLVKEGVI
ncbi:unnamed protein product [Peniophora sp. CBMAI 1063]|nr:unnamed protein product [Peniophora sp. CBMAI 1063]